tara:strand:+ start:83 stop:925 length:843 start_codon:yes stop_codon:yes gene_type:complete
MNKINLYKSDLDKNGFIHVKNFFTDDEIKILRNYAIKSLDTDKENAVDVLSINETQDVLLSNKFLSFISNLIGENKTTYFGNSSIFYGKDLGLNNFHIDARNDEESYSVDYPIYRVAIYLQNHKDFSGGIKFRLKSHKKLLIRLFPIHELIKTLKKIVKNGFPIKDIFFRGRICNMRSEQNDLIVWNMRTHHAGRFKLFKFFPSIAINPVLERILPDFIFRKEEKKRFAYFIAFSKDQSEQFQRFYKDNIERHNKQISNSKYLNDEYILNRLNKNNISVT